MGIRPMPSDMGNINAITSNLPAAAVAATAVSPKLATIRVITPLPAGIRIIPSMEGTAKRTICRHAGNTIRVVNERNLHNLCRLPSAHTIRHAPVNCEIIVANAAPAMPMAGIPAKPKMKIGSRITLINIPATIMPLASPIGSNKGLATRDFIQILIDEIDLPIIVDAGIGRPSQACEAMEMGAAAIMANTALATAGDLPMMASAFRQAIEAGRKAYLSGLGRVLSRGASASDPLTGFLRD